MKKCTLLLLLFVFVGVLPINAQGASIEIGPRAGIDVGGDLKDPFIGVEARIGTESLPVVINPVFDYYFVGSGVTFMQISANALYDFDISNSQIEPYAGAGLGISRTSVDLGTFGSSSSTNVGLNLIGGAAFTAGNLKPFAQAQLTLGDANLFTLAGGLLFSVGGN